MRKSPSELFIESYFSELELSSMGCCLLFASHGRIAQIRIRKGVVPSQLYPMGWWMVLCPLLFFSEHQLCPLLLMDFQKKCVDDVYSRSGDVISLYDHSSRQTSCTALLSLSSRGSEERRREREKTIS